MGRFRLVRRVLLILFVSFCAVVFLALIFVQVEQRIFRRRAERLLSEIQSLELRKAPWPEAQARLAHWSAHTEVSPHCDEQKCSLTITMNEFAAGVVSQMTLPSRLDDYLRWKLNLPYNTGPFVHLFEALRHLHMRLGGRPARIEATIGMRDGIVWSKRFEVLIETYVYANPELLGGRWYEYSFLATVGSVPHFPSHASWFDPQLTLHPNYKIGRPGGCGGCVAGWANFTPYAEPADVHRLLELDLSCLTRWHPCKTQTDIMPVAWMQYEAERDRVDKLWFQVACSPLTMELLGRDSDIVVVGEVVAYKRDAVGQGHRRAVEVRLLQRMKGAADWNIGQTLDLLIRDGEGGDIESLRMGAHFIFAVNKDYSRPMEIDLGSPCRVPLPNEANLNLVRRGIDQDYSAADQAK